MSIYHCNIKMVGRTGGKSAVAASAYRSGEKLYDEETGLIHDFTRKGGVVMSEILLPENAPEEYRDRQILWNAVQAVEKRSDAQMAREVEVALPIEMSREQQIECIRNYVMENFVNEGMIADWALHDKGDGNPHAHILLTVRGFTETGEWEQKTRSVYANARDDQGRAIYDANRPSYNPKEPKDENGHRPSELFRIPKMDADGKQKVRVREGKGEEKLWERINIPANNWNDRTMAEIWRASWAEECNHYLTQEKQIDHRSFARQGIEDKLPTIHEGVTARKIEKHGDISDRCETNREILRTNAAILKIKTEVHQLINELMVAIKEAVNELRSRIGRIQERAAGHSADDGRSEPNGRADGTDAGRDRSTGSREQQIEQRERKAVGITEIVQRGVDESKQREPEVARTESEIAAIFKQTKLSREERDERLQRIMERRRSSRSGGTATGRTRTKGTADTRTLIDQARAGVHRADAVEKDSQSKRAYRDVVRERSAAAERARAEEAIRRAMDARGKRATHSRGHDPEL